MENVLNKDALRNMVLHWTATPPNGYLGSPYGSDLLTLLQKPMDAPAADSFLRKLREDIAIFQQLPIESVNLFYGRLVDSKEKKTLIIEILGELVDVQLTNNQTP